ncbi:MAG: cytochrome c [Gallionella sp.]|nr:cytochrome c [Gallionella sp.]
MKKLSLVICLLLAPAAAQAFPWDMDMANQVSVKPQEPVGMSGSMKSFPQRSVPVAGTTTYIKDQQAANNMVNPTSANTKSVANGGRLFDVYCTPCHGRSGVGDGLVGEKLIMKPWNLTNSNDQHKWDVKEYGDGYIFGYMSLGGAVMPSYANDLSASERWDVVNYIRVELQKAPAAPSVAQTK